MKKFFLPLSFLFLIILSFSCGKEGPAGALGPQGDVGPVGPAGKDGSIIYSGRTVPGSDVGNAGDYYVNIPNGDFYGPKQSSGWGSPFNLRGSKGDKGDKGSQILSGNGTPSTALGAIGDYYLDKQNLMLYGPKLSATNWGAGLQLGGGSASPNIKSWVANHVPVADFFGVNIPALTNDIFNNGAVLTYGVPSDARDASTTWQFFPFSYEITNPAGLTISFTIKALSFQNGFVRFGATGGVEGIPNPYGGATVNIRIVLIQGVSGGILREKPVDFGVLKSMYHLRD